MPHPRASLHPPYRLLLLTLAALPFQLTVSAQAPTPQLSPKAAYDQAMHPLELTRHSISNWSDTEVGALTVTMAQAKLACDARDPANFTGDDLIDLARLCSLGQDWSATIQTCRRYIDADTPKPQLTRAYAGLIEAQLHLKDEPAGFSSAKSMLTTIASGSYDALIAETLDETIDWMRFVYTADALTLAALRQPLLLTRLKAAAAALTPPTATTITSPPADSQTLHALYADGLDLATLQQLSGIPPSEIAATVAALDAALPATLAPDDAIPIAADRRRYDLLGHPLPNLSHPAHPADPHHPIALSSLDVTPHLPQLPAVDAITALLLFPDWCAQCLRMAATIPQTVFSVAGNEAYMHNLLAQTVPSNPAPSPASTPKPAGTPSTPADAANLLRGTPTLLIDPSFLNQFAASDFPFLILTDSQGIVRVLQPVSDEALQPGGTVDAAIARVGDQWPDPHRSPHPAPSIPAPAKP